MTTTPHSATTPDPTAGIDLLAEMRKHEDAWQQLRAGFTDKHGDIKPKHYLDYDQARGDHGCDLADRLTDWIARLAAAAPPER